MNAKSNDSFTKRLTIGSHFVSHLFLTGYMASCTRLVVQSNVYIFLCSSTLLVIWILGRVYGLIFPVKVYILPSRQARENIHFDREYESIYPAKNPYNEYVLLQSDQFENWTIKELEGQDSWGKKESWVKKILIYYVQHLSGISVNNLKEQLYLFLKL